MGRAYNKNDFAGGTSCADKERKVFRMNLIELLKVLFLGLVEGVTEWLPVSSTGHMLLVDEFLQLSGSAEFKEMFFIVIQLGAIMAVVLLFWKKMFPFQFADKTKPVIVKETFSLWFKVVAACIPGAVVTILFDDVIEAHLHTPTVIALTLILYGIVFIAIERKNKNKVYRVTEAESLTKMTAFKIGCFQMLSLIPGTSRSGSTIIGSMCVGVSRTAAAEFSFFLALPVMLGASMLKIAKYILDGAVAFTGVEVMTMIVGIVTAFVVSLVSLKFLVGFVRRHSFEVFGWYRIVLGAAVIVYFLVTR